MTHWHASRSLSVIAELVLVFLVVTPAAGIADTLPIFTLLYGYLSPFRRLPDRLYPHSDVSETDSSSSCRTKIVLSITSEASRIFGRLLL